MIPRYLPVIFLALPALVGCSLPRETAAEVNGRPLPASEVEAEYQKFIAQFGQLSPALERSLPQVRRGIIDRLVDRELMFQEAEKRRVRPTTAEIAQGLSAAREGMSEQEFEATLAEAGADKEQWRRAVERDLILEKLQRAVTEAVAVSEREIAEWLAQHRDRREQPQEARAAQILVRTREDALEARRRILGGAAFSAVARDLSLSPDAERGGDLGYFPRGQMPPEFDEVVFSLAPGRLSDVVESPYGYHLFLVTDRREARVRTDDEIGADAREALLAEKKDTAFRAWLKELRRGAKIRYNHKIVPP